MVNNGSIDDTNNILEKIIHNYPHAKYISLRNNIGYGGGILEGLKNCKGKVIGWTHADLQTDPLDAIRAFQFFNKNNTNKNLFLKGNRLKRPILDQLFTFGMSIFETILLRTFLYDINAQPTIFERSFYESWVNPPTDFSLDLYSFYLAKKKKFQIKRIKVKFIKRVSGVSKWNTGFTSKLKFILRTIKYSLKLKKILSK